MIISYREGCSGSWLAQLLTDPGIVYYRQDLAGVNIPQEVFHFDGHNDLHVPKAFDQYQGQKYITCHSSNYQLLRQYWPDRASFRIVPLTHTLDCIESAFFKLGPGAQCSSVDQALEYIKNYFNLHMFVDPRPTLADTHIIDYGQLRYIDQLQEICKSLFKITLSKKQEHFAKEYWSLQCESNRYFSAARFIFEHEHKHNFNERDRLWSIDHAPVEIAELVNFMQYQQMQD